MNKSLSIGRLFNIQLGLDYSWFLIFAIITIGLALGLFPQAAPGLSIPVYILMGVITSLLFFGSVLFHEIMHSLVAKYYGLEIEGIRLMIFGGVSELNEEPKSPKAEFLMAIAGPLSSILLGIFFFSIFLANRNVLFSPVLEAPTFWLAYINIILGVFNLLPGFPLDGGRVLRSILWSITGSLLRATRIASGIGKGLSALMISGGAVLTIMGNFNALWFVLLGWYLFRAADAGYQQAIVQSTLENVTVRDVMQEKPPTVPADITLEQLFNEFFMRSKWTVFPVTDGRLDGTVALAGMDAVPRERWSSTEVKEVMQPISAKMTAKPEEEVVDVLGRLTSGSEAGKNGSALFVIDGEELIGIVNRSDIVNAFHQRSQEKDMAKEQHATVGAAKDKEKQEPAA